MPIGAVSGFISEAEFGVSGEVDGHTVVFGNTAQMQRIGIDPTELEVAADAFRQAGGTLFVAVDRRLAGFVTVADPVRRNAREALTVLRASGLRLIMLSGDNLVTAQAVATAVGGLDEVHAGLQPEDEARIVKELKVAGGHVAMAGDGINDAPALAAADVGLAMRSDTDVAIESAGITLTGGDIAATVRAHHLSKTSMRNIRQNLFFSFLCNGIGVPVAAGVSYPDVRHPVVTDCSRGQPWPCRR